MSLKTITGTIRLAVVSSSEEPFRRLSIEIQDELSRSVVAKIELSCSQFGELISGQLIENAQITVTSNPELIGLKRRTKRVTVIAPFLGYDRHEYEAWLVEHMQHAHPGCNIDPYLGSKGSIKHIKDGVMLTYLISWYENLPATERYSQTGVEK